MMETMAPASLIQTILASTGGQLTYKQNTVLGKSNSTTDRASVSCAKLTKFIIHIQRFLFNVNGPQLLGGKDII